MVFDGRLSNDPVEPQKDRAKLDLLPPPFIPPSPGKIFATTGAPQPSVLDRSLPLSSPFDPEMISPPLPSTMAPYTGAPAPFLAPTRIPSLPAPLSTNTARVPSSMESIPDKVATSLKLMTEPGSGQVNSVSSSSNADASIVDYPSLETSNIGLATMPQYRTLPRAPPPAPAKPEALAEPDSSPPPSPKRQQKLLSKSSSAPAIRPSVPPALPASQRFRTYPRASSSTPSALSLRNITPDQVRSAVTSKFSTPIAMTAAGYQVALRTQNRRRPGCITTSEDVCDDDDDDDSDDSDAGPTPQSSTFHRRADATRSLSGSTLDRVRRLTGTLK